MLLLWQPVKMKMSYLLFLILSHEEARKKRIIEFIVPSHLMGEGEDEGDSSG